MHLRSSLSTALAAIAVFVFLGCGAPRTDHGQGPQNPSSWRMVYAHDENGASQAGSKEELVQAVRDGKPVRVYVKGRRVEHSADALFLTIFDGEIFAQIAEIQMQAPSLDPPTVSFREPGRYWRAIYATTGKVQALGDGNQPRENQAPLKWFVQE